MAKANTETTFVAELLNARMFKPNQGRVVRQVTALSVAVVFVATAWRLKNTVLTDLPENLAWLGLAIPAVVGVGGLWLAYRLVNWPKFANFLVSVEAELDKVTWADWDYLKRATAVVLVVMVLLGAFLFFSDVLWQEFFGRIGFLDLKESADELKEAAKK